MPLCANVKSERTPPGFMNAATAAPVPASAVAASWASAIRLPAAFSPESSGVRVMSAEIRPITRSRSGAAIVL